VYETEFKEPASKNYIEQYATFERPAEFNDEIDQIKKLFKLQQV